MMSAGHHDVSLTTPGPGDPLGAARARFVLRAATMLPLHILAGLLAIGAGAVALFARKGATLHRHGGMVFVAAMLFMSASGGVMAALKGEHLNTSMGLLTFYVVATALRAVRLRRLHWGDAAAMLVALAVAGYQIRLALGGVRPAFIFASLALLAAVGDLRMLLRGGLQGTQRIARHLWRMGFAMFIATGSLFLGQAKVFPKPVRIMPLLAIPVLVVVAVSIYWLARVRFRGRPA
jgi:uncharacterized membrane protein